MPVFNGELSRYTIYRSFFHNANAGDTFSYTGLRQYFAGETLESTFISWRWRNNQGGFDSIPRGTYVAALVMTYSDDPNIVPPPPNDPADVILQQDYLFIEVAASTPALHGAATTGTTWQWPGNDIRTWTGNYPRWVPVRAALWYVMHSSMISADPDVENLTINLTADLVNRAAPGPTMATAAA